MPLNPLSGATTRDIITDFTVGVDKIDLSLIDANSRQALDQAFTFLGTADFSFKPGELIFRQYDVKCTANDKTIIYGDINGDHRRRLPDRAHGPQGVDGGRFHFVEVGHCRPHPSATLNRPATPDNVCFWWSCGQCRRSRQREVYNQA